MTRSMLVRVRRETAKNRKERTVVARGGEYFERIKTFSKHLRLGDFVFADNDTGNMLSKKVYYGLWDDLIQKLSFGGRVKKLTYYSLRHFGITMRRYAGVSFEDLSLLAGTSYNFIENHYSPCGCHSARGSSNEGFSDRQGWVHHKGRRPKIACAGAGEISVQAERFDDLSR